GHPRLLRARTQRLLLQLPAGAEEQVRRRLPDPGRLVGGHPPRPPPGGVPGHGHHVFGFLAPMKKSAAPPAKPARESEVVMAHILLPSDANPLNAAFGGK